MKYNVSCTSTMCQIEKAVQVSTVWPTISRSGLIWMAIKAAWNSAQKRVEKVLKGTKGNVADELGFMHKIKTEVIIFV